MKTTKEKPCYAFCELTESDLLLEDYFFVPLILFLSDTYPKMLGKKNFAKEAITYALIQDRLNLSKLHAEKYTDAEGRLFCCLTRKELCTLTGFSERTAVTIFENLETLGLIKRVSQGPNAPWKIYMNEYNPLDLHVRERDASTRNIAFKMPYLLLKAAPYTSLSLEARVLYSYMFNLTISSFRNMEKYSDEKGVYIMIPQEEICAILQVNRNTAAKFINELEGFGLLQVQRQAMPGKNAANKYYLKNFKGAMPCTEKTEVQNQSIRRCKNRASGGAKMKHPEVQKLSNRECKILASGGAENTHPGVQKTGPNRFNINKLTETDGLSIDLDKRERKESMDDANAMKETPPRFSGNEGKDDERNSGFLPVGPGPRKNLLLTREQITYLQAECERDKIDLELVIKQASMKKRTEEKKGKTFDPEDDFDIVLLKLSDYQKDLADRNRVIQQFDGLKKKSTAEELYQARFQKKPTKIELDMLQKSMDEFGKEKVKEILHAAGSIGEMRSWFVMHG